MIPRVSSSSLLLTYLESTSMHRNRDTIREYCAQRQVYVLCRDGYYYELTEKN
jgi:hypothetical protein